MGGRLRAWLAAALLLWPAVAGAAEVEWSLSKKDGRAYLSGMPKESEVDNEFWAHCRADGAIEIGAGAESHVGRGSGEAVTLKLASRAQEGDADRASRAKAPITQMTGGIELRAIVARDASAVRGAGERQADLRVGTDQAVDLAGQRLEGEGRGVPAKRANSGAERPWPRPSTIRWCCRTICRCRRTTAPRAISTGLRLPDVALAATDGASVNLSRLKGRTVVYVYPRTGRPGRAGARRLGRDPGRARLHAAVLRLPRSFRRS